MRLQQTISVIFLKNLSDIAMWGTVIVGWCGSSLASSPFGKQVHVTSNIDSSIEIKQRILVTITVVAIIIDVVIEVSSSVMQTTIFPTSKGIDAMIWRVFIVDLLAKADHAKPVISARLASYSLNHLCWL